jgi:hypothetical protein
MYNVEERIELWGLQIPHNSMRPSLSPDQAMIDALEAGGEVSVPATPLVPPTPMTSRDREVVAWSSVDRLNMSIGLLYALCNYALDNDVRWGRRWALMLPLMLPLPLLRALLRESPGRGLARGSGRPHPYPSPRRPPARPPACLPLLGALLGQP